MIRIDAMWLAVDPVDMRAGADRLIARVVEVFGAAQAHNGYLFANARGTRMKLVVHDGFGVWCATRRLNQGRFIWPGAGAPLQQPTLTLAFLDGWTGTITCDDYKGYDAVFRAEGRTEAGCLAHARRKFDELAKAHASPVATQAIERIAWLYRIEQEAREMPAPDRLRLRQLRARPLWDELHVWLKLERTRVADGGGIAAALDYSLKRWDALGRFLQNGEVSIDNKHIERLMRPWAMGRKAWLFAGSELAGQLAAMVMSLVQSAKLNGHDPWVYLKDVLERLLAHPNHRIDELLPHRWGQAAASKMPTHEEHRSADR